MNWKKLDWQGYNPPHTDDPNDEVHVDHQTQEISFTYSFDERWATDMELACKGITKNTTCEHP